MPHDLAMARPLWELAAVLFVLGIGGGLHCRDRAAWWMSQGLLLLSFVVGFAADQVSHASVNLRLLGVWVPVAWFATWVLNGRSRRASPAGEVAHD
jgi:NADH:ubiquinone oxidoreductase subunit K